MKNILRKIKEFFQSGKYKFLLEHADQIIKVVNIFKMVVESRAVTFYVEISKNKIDDAVLEILHNVLPSTLRALQIASDAEKCLRMTGSAQIQCIANILMQLHDSQRNIFYRELSRRIMAESAKQHNQSFSDAEIDTALQVRYFESKNA